MIGLIQPLRKRRSALYLLETFEGRNKLLQTVTEHQPVRVNRPGDAYDASDPARYPSFSEALPGGLPATKHGASGVRRRTSGADAALPSMCGLSHSLSKRAPNFPLTRISHRGDVTMAQAFFPQRVLASEERSGHYVRGSMWALRGKGQASARPAPSVPTSPLNGANQGTEYILVFFHVSSDPVRSAGLGRSDPTPPSIPKQASQQDL